MDERVGMSGLSTYKIDTVKGGVEGASVARWLHCFFNISPFTTVEMFVK